MTNVIKKLKAELTAKADELNKISAAYTGNAKSETQILEAELAHLIAARAEVRADAAMGLDADETPINHDILNVEASLAISRRNDAETAATDAVLLSRRDAIQDEITKLQGLVLAERRIIMASVVANAEAAVQSSANALMLTLIKLEKVVIAANDGGLLHEARPVYRLPERFELPLLSQPVNVDFSSRSEIHAKTQIELDGLLMN